MKKLRFMLLGIPLLVVFSLYGCSDEDDAQLKVSSTTCAFTSEGGEKIIIVGTDEPAWDAQLTQGDQTHFTVSVTTDRLTVKAEANLSTELLSAVITVTAGNVSIPIEIVQNGAAASAEGQPLSILPATDNYRFTYAGGEFVVRIFGDTEWTAQLASDQFDISIDKETSTVKITAGANITDTDNNSTLTISDGVEKFDIQLTQLTKDQDPYNMLIGRWDLYSTRWELENQIIDDGGYSTYTSCYFIEDEYNKSLTMIDFFIDGSTLPVYFDVDFNRLYIPLGWTIRYYGKFFLLVDVNLSAGNYNYNDMLTGIISDDFNTITFEGLDERLSLGIIGIEDNTQMKMTDIPYAIYPNIEFRKRYQQSGLAEEASPEEVNTGFVPKKLAADIMEISGSASYQQSF